MKYRIIPFHYFFTISTTHFPFISLPWLGGRGCVGTLLLVSPVIASPLFGFAEEIPLSRLLPVWPRSVPRRQGTLKYWFSTRANTNGGVCEDLMSSRHRLTSSCDLPIDSPGATFTVDRQPTGGTSSQHGMLDTIGV